MCIDESEVKRVMQKNARWNLWKGPVHLQANNIEEPDNEKNQ